MTTRQPSASATQASSDSGVDAHPQYSARSAGVPPETFLSLNNSLRGQPAGILFRRLLNAFFPSGLLVPVPLVIAALYLILPLQCTGLGQENTRWVIQQQRQEFTIYSEFPVDVDAVCHQLQAVTKILQQQFGIEPTRAPVELILFNTRKSYEDYLKDELPEALNRRAVFFSGNDVSQIYAWKSRWLTTDLRHEITHVRLHQHLPFVPLWIDEGIAEYLEAQSEESGLASRREAVRWKARFGFPPRLTSLEQLQHAAEMQSDDYRNSWAWICYLMNDSDTSREALKSYLRKIHNGEAPGKFSSWVQPQISDLQQSANSYFRKSQFRLNFDESRREPYPDQNSLSD